MLVLSRRISERIKIGDNITITVVRITEGQVQLGIDAPKDIKVYRQEIFDLIHSETDERKGWLSDA